MTIEDRITLAKDLIKKREDIDRQLAELFNGGTVATRKLKCSICGSEEHNARTCPVKNPSKPQPNPTQSPSPSPHPTATAPASFMGKAFGGT